jgi:phosphoribosylformylglycinamidine synthase PurS subunit
LLLNWLRRDGAQIDRKSEKTMKARVTVMLKSGVLDVQGEAVRHALGTLGFSGVNGVRQGKVLELDLSDTDRSAAEAKVNAMCEKLLSNTVIESFRVEML